MGRRLRSSVVAPVVLVLALVASLGPHLAILGYQFAGARPPASLVFFCPLHSRSLAHPGPVWSLHAKPFVADRSSR
jgi:hypothetical protein